jgi:peptide-methionine (S)-S-oxide reductase
MSDDTETAILAGGCSWIMQQLLRHPDGVISTCVGWTGGEGDNPTEENPQGHAEAVEVVFDPERLSYRDVLEYFFQVHRADLGEDLVGSIYRSESSIRARSSAGWPSRRSPTSTPQGTGSARS